MFKSFIEKIGKRYFKSDGKKMLKSYNDWLNWEPYFWNDQCPGLCDYSWEGPRPGQGADCGHSPGLRFVSGP